MGVSHNGDLWEGLAGLFDMEDFAELLRSAAPSVRLGAYLQIVKLLTYRSKTSGNDFTNDETKKMIDELFNPKK